MLGWRQLPVGLAPRFVVSIHQEGEIKCSNERYSCRLLRRYETQHRGLTMLERLAKESDTTKH